MSTGDFFFRFLLYSLFAHIILFGFFTFDLLFPKKNIQIKNSIRVDTIGLSELRRKIESSTQSKGSRLKQVKKQTRKQTKPLKTKKKSMQKKVMKKKVKSVSPKKDKGGKTASKKKGDIKKEQNQAMDKINALTRNELEQNQAIDKIEAMESIEQIKRELEPSPYAGEAISKGNAQEKGGMVTDFQVLQYFTSLRAHINIYWSLPQELADKNFRAEIYAIIDSNGRVLMGKIIKSSGNEDFDARVLETIERAAPMPKPSTEEVEKLLSKGVVFKFPE